MGKKLNFEDRDLDQYKVIGGEMFYNGIDERNFEQFRAILVSASRLELKETTQMKGIRAFAGFAKKALRLWLSEIIAKEGKITLELFFDRK